MLAMILGVLIIVSAYLLVRVTKLENALKTMCFYTEKLTKDVEAGIISAVEELDLEVRRMIEERERKFHKKEGE